MPDALVQAVPVLALAGMLVVAFRHPRGGVEAATGLAAAGTTVAVGALSPSRAATAVTELLPVVVFLAAILVVAELAAADGLFTAVGALVARSGRGSPQRMLLLTFAAAAATTATLSLDATVVLLTPVVAAAAARSLVDPRPMVVACVRLANSASLLLPVANLTNLLAFGSLHLTFLEFARLTGPVWVAVIAVEYVGHRWFFRDDLRLVAVPDDSRARVPRVAAAVLVVMLAGFALTSPFGVAPAWVACGAVAVLAATAASRGRASLPALVDASHIPFVVFVLCLGVVVAALGEGVLGGALGRLLPDGSSLADLLVVAVVAMVTANLVNNLPATLLVVPLVAPAGATAVVAALVGLNAGSNLTYAGSLANLLWRRTLARAGTPPSARVFHLLSAVVTVPAVTTGVVVLWAWQLTLARW